MFNVKRQIKVRDFMSREGVSLDVLNDQISLDDTLIRGEFYQKELRKGLFIHGSDAIEEHSFTATSSQNEGLSCIFFLEGNVDVTIGDQLFDFKSSPNRVMEAAAILKTNQESFQRVTRQKQHVRHLVITATPEWLNAEGMEEVYGENLASRLFDNNMLALRWTPSSRLCELVQEILNPSVFMPELLNLYLETRAIEIISETIVNLVKADCSFDNRSVLTQRENIRLQRARELINDNLSEPLSVEFIAQEAGVSTSGLQRLFRHSEGVSVFEYVRRVRLDQALTALQSCSISVQDASVIAGYANPTNFATAFKRQFGLTPREAARKSSLR